VERLELRDFSYEMKRRIGGKNRLYVSEFMCPLLVRGLEHSLTRFVNRRGDVKEYGVWLSNPADFLGLVSETLESGCVPATRE
jgi:hypothetical protein